MIFTIIGNYRIGLFLKDNLSLKSKKLILTLGISFNLLFLIYFKYLGFSIIIINNIFNQFGLEMLSIPQILLPLGISFYTFQSISYLIDAYKKPDLVQNNLLNLALYISFFPQLIAGPIVRYHDINDQIINRSHNISKIAYGIERFIIGLSKKVLLANVFGEITDGIFALPFHSVPAYYAWIGILSYTLQIYFDFSGYSDMAVGLGRIFGFKFLENFNYPYSANSITDFWKRWHISLSSWFKDYLYIPLGGNRKGNIRTYINLWLVFFVAGLWHGAAFNFIVWGLGHGFILIIEKVYRKYSLIKKNKFTILLSHFYTLFVIVLLFLPFRLGTRESAKTILKMFAINSNSLTDITTDPQLYLLVDTRFYIMFIIGILCSFPWWKKTKIIVNRNLHPSLVNIIKFLKYFSILILFILSYCNIADSSYNPFIYFRF